MTLQEVNVNTVQRRLRNTSPVVPPASVWDLNSSKYRHRVQTNVRTLHRLCRTNQREGLYRVEAHPERKVPFENRHGTIRSLMLGAFMGFSMIVGAAMGGVFEDAEPHNNVPVDYTAEIQSIDAR